MASRLTGSLPFALNPSNGSVSWVLFLGCFGCYFRKNDRGTICCCCLLQSTNSLPERGELTSTLDQDRIFTISLTRTINHKASYKWRKKERDQMDERRLQWSKNSLIPELRCPPHCSKRSSKNLELKLARTTSTKSRSSGRRKGNH